MPTVILVPPTIVSLVYNHEILGLTARFSTTVALQVRVYTSPAVVEPSELMITLGGGSPSVVKVRGKEASIV